MHIIVHTLSLVIIVVYNVSLYYTN